jgi:hypothetical protein
MGTISGTTISGTVYQIPDSNWASPDATLIFGPRFMGRRRRCALASNCFTSLAAGRTVWVDSRIRSWSSDSHVLRQAGGEVAGVTPAILSPVGFDRTRKNTDDKIVGATAVN